jgi:DNA primase
MRSIIEVIEAEGLETFEKGNLFLAFCPFHIDKNNPNLTIFIETNSFYCFACGAGYSPVDFVKRHRQINNAAAREIVYGENYLKEALLQVKTNDKTPVLSIHLVVSEEARSVLQKHPEQSDKVLEKLKEIDAIPPTLENMALMLEKLRGIQWT